MIYTFEINETAESQPLIAHLKTLKYVKQKKEHTTFLTDEALANAVKEAEKGASIPWEDFKRETKTWKKQITK